MRLSCGRETREVHLCQSGGSSKEKEREVLWLHDLHMHIKMSYPTGLKTCCDQEFLNLICGGLDCM